MTSDRTVKKLYEWNPISTRLVGRLKIDRKRYKEELRIVKVNKGTKCVHDRVKWKETDENARIFKT